MAVKLFSKEMVEQLNSNKYVLSATNKRITYTDSFKELILQLMKMIDAFKMMITIVN